MSILAALPAVVQHEPLPPAPHRAEWHPPKPLRAYVYQQHLSERANHLGRFLRYPGWTMNHGPWSGWIKRPVSMIADAMAAKRVGDLDWSKSTVERALLEWRKAGQLDRACLNKQHRKRKRCCGARCRGRGLRFRFLSPEAQPEAFEPPRIGRPRRPIGPPESLTEVARKSDGSSPESLTEVARYLKIYYYEELQEKEQESSASNAQVHGRSVPESQKQESETEAVAVLEAELCAIVTRASERDWLADEHRTRWRLSAVRRQLDAGNSVADLRLAALGVAVARERELHRGSVFWLEDDADPVLVALADVAQYKARAIGWLSRVEGWSRRELEDVEQSGEIYVDALPALTLPDPDTTVTG